MIGLSTEMARVKEVDWEVDRRNFVWWPEVTRSDTAAKWLRMLGYFRVCSPFSSPEPTIFLACGRDRELWLCPTPEVRDSRTSRQIWQIWLVDNTKLILCACSENRLRPHSRPQSLRSFWPAAGIKGSTKGSNHFEITMGNNRILVIRFN